MNRLASITILSILLGGLILPLMVEPVKAVYHPRDLGEAYDVGFSGIIEPTNPTVLEKLNSLCPVIDAQHFAVNLQAVYNSAMLIPYAYDSTVYGKEYWQTSEETILLNRGDCEDQAINLATLIEALYQQTYGYIPINLVWVVVGHVETGGGGGGHGWVLLNEGLLPQETVQQIKASGVSESIIDIILGGVSNIANSIYETITTTLDLSLLDDKNDKSLSILYLGERYFELEPTWDLPISEFYNKEYPYTEVWAIFNSQKVEYNPTFYPTTKPVFTGAEIKNVAFDNEIVVGNSFTINVTVQNYECGIIGADLIVILKNNGVEFTRQTAFVYRYVWQMHTFVFTLNTTEENIGQLNLSSELYFKDWDNQVYIRDYKNLIIKIVSLPSPTSQLEAFLNVPYQSQQDPNWCGPASLTMVFGFWGFNTTQADVADQVFDKEANTTYVNEMFSFPQKIGFDSTAFDGSIPKIRQYINSGYPLIVLQNSTTSSTKGHYRIVTGYDDYRSRVVTNDPFYGANYNITYSDFANMWKFYSNWTLFIIPNAPFPTPTPIPTPTPSPSPTAPPSSTPPPTPSPTPSPTSSPAPTPTPSPSLSPSPTPSPSPTAVPTNDPTATPTVTPSPAPSQTPTTTPTPVPTSNPTATISPTASPTITPTPTSKLSAILDLSCSSSVLYDSFRIQINGWITENNNGIASQPIAISYSITNGRTWQDLTSVNTNSDGTFTAEWTPSVTGNYVIKASWVLDDSVSKTVNLAVLPFAGKSSTNIFSVASNSTISDLTFNSTSNDLTFSVTGESETLGYTDVTISKSLINDILQVRVYIDGVEVHSSTTETTDSWILHFTYQHSTHKITLQLNYISTSSASDSQYVWYAVAIIIIAVMIIGALLYLKKKIQ